MGMQISMEGGEGCKSAWRVEGGANQHGGTKGGANQHGGWKREQISMEGGGRSKSACWLGCGLTAHHMDAQGQVVKSERWKSTWAVVHESPRTMTEDNLQQPRRCVWHTTWTVVPISRIISRSICREAENKKRGPSSKNIMLAPPHGCTQTLTTIRYVEFGDDGLCHTCSVHVP